MPFYSLLLDAIPAYTGLSPAAFFTILALMIGVYRFVCGFFVDPHQLRADPAKPPIQAADAWAPPPPPVQIGEVTEEELRAYDGSDTTKPLLMAIKGHIYDVSISRLKNCYRKFYNCCFSVQLLRTLLVESKSGTTAV
ncbi:Membrane steroid-binding protein 2 [Asimina triloba]